MQRCLRVEGGFVGLAFAGRPTRIAKANTTGTKAMIETLSLLTIALLFGGMTLYSFGFAAFVFTALPPEVAGPTIRKAFPHFYVFVAGTAMLAALLCWDQDRPAAFVLATVAATAVVARQVLMPAINVATDGGHRSRFKLLHGLSVVVTLAHIAATIFLLTRFA